MILSQDELTLSGQAMTRQPGTNTVAGQTHPDTKRHTQHNYNLVRDTSRKTRAYKHRHPAFRSEYHA